ncbi:MAG: DNA polymerase II large subunit [Candidatus Verstraetearchaeota archaeon]|nr:DNA polymerase II large subunit [Candidatus Verstraetearchaeota archaeon]
MSENYFTWLEEKTSELYALAEKARKKGLDPKDTVEIYKAQDLASRVEGLIGLKGIAERIRELDLKFSREQTGFTIIEEIINGRFGKFEDEVAAEYAMRTALAIVTEGITAAPLQGIDKVKIRTNADGTKHLAVYYAGPMRSAGGTEQALTVLFAEKIRKLLHLDRYKITEEEIGRFIEELRLYERKVSNFQYHPSDEDLRRILPNIPIEITGPQTDDIQVSVYRNLPRIETNSVRGGALRVVNDGVYGKASKLKKVVDKLGFTDWEWLTRIKSGEKKEEKDFMGITPDIKYLVDIVGGRPIFSHPSRFGGFRLRYGRSRNTGLACVGINPVTMIILESFIAVGTQLRVERPGKSATITPVDGIEGPVVRLKNGDVLRLEDEITAERVKNDVEKILFLGDMAVAVGEFLENNHRLMPAGYCEEIWSEELGQKIKDKFNGRYDLASVHLGIMVERLSNFVNLPTLLKPSPEEALKISRSLGVPLHPRYTYFWERLHVEELRKLRAWFKTWRTSNGLEPIPEIKRLLETACVPHRLVGGKVVFEDFPIMEALFGTENDSNQRSPLGFLSEISGLCLREKGRSFIGARMGRPEKARERMMSPPTHVLFPVGLAGGPQRDLAKAASGGSFVTAINIRHCKNCSKIVFERVCPDCGGRTTKVYTCPNCNQREYFTCDDGTGSCPKCGSKAVPYEERSICLELFPKLLKKLEANKDLTVKGVKGLSNPTKVPETLEKGILRSKHKIYVYKDGTVRYDITNAPLTHFKPCEAHVSIEKLKELGYTKDIFGRELEDENQILELKVQDIIVPFSCGEYLYRTSKYVDEMLIKIYGKEPFYNLRSREELLGHIVIGLAPHTSAGIIGRIVGFTEARVCYAHPFWHAAKRRNCDGDEDAIMLALEAFIDFSKEYLPDKIGGLMDAPLVVTTTIDPTEVDDECHNMETTVPLPLEFYRLCEEYKEPKEALKCLKIVKDQLRTAEQYSGLRFSIQTDRIDRGPLTTLYDKIKSMVDKVERQLCLAEKISAVDCRDVAERLLKHHFIPDLAGNLRAFSTQRLRCTKCGARYRRIPLKGVCVRCNGNIILTVHEGNVKKYLEAATSLAEKYNLSPFVKQQIALIGRGLYALITTQEENGAKEDEDSYEIGLSQFMGSQ